MLRLVPPGPEVDWIRPFLLHGDRPKGSPALVGDFVPGGFERYCRLLHAAFRHQDIDDTICVGNPPDWYGREEHASLWVPRAQMAADHGVEVECTFSPSDLCRHIADDVYDSLYTGPESGFIIPFQMQALVEALRQETNGSAVHYYYDWESVPTEDGARYYVGSLDDYPDTWNVSDVTSSPTYAWPSNRNWLVCSIEPFYFSFVGGSERVIGSLSAHPMLECLEVEPRTPVRGR